MQCKDIPDLPILRFLYDLGRWGTILADNENSVQLAMPVGVPEKLARAKMGGLIRRGLVDGCVCGCRGDFELTDRGLQAVRQYLQTEIVASPPRRESDAVGHPR